jgi:HK97 family phage major capsid protein
MTPEYKPFIKFTSLARHLMLAGGNPQAAVGTAAREWRESDDVMMVLRSAVASGSTSDATWAGPLVEYRTIERGAVEALRQVSVFQFTADDPASVKVPLRTRLVVVTSGATASQQGEGAAIPVSAMALATAEIPEHSVAGLVVVSNETLLGPSGATVLASAIRNALAAAQDAAFIPGLIDSSTPTVSGSGSTAYAIGADLSSAADEMALHAGSKLLLVVTPDTYARLALKTTADGAFAFPDLAIGGVGTIAGSITVMPCAALPAGDSSTTTAMLIDISKVAVGADLVLLDGSRQAALQMAGDPTANALTGTGSSIVSMFQNNCSALKATRLIGFEKLYADAAVVMENVQW